MPRPRFTPRPYYDSPTTPFLNAEEAWFWFIRCQKARADGARFEAKMGSMARPCDPDDLFRAVMDLARRRHLTAEHLRTLDTFGLSQRPPDPRCREEERPPQLWDEALNKLSILLRTKGIIE